MCWGINSCPCLRPSTPRGQETKAQGYLVGWLCGLSAPAGVLFWPVGTQRRWVLLNFCRGDIFRYPVAAHRT